MPRSDDLLREVLQRVSRSFYLSIAILPRSLREPIGLAYLLARAADTVADTRLISRPERLAHLDMLRRAYRGERVDPRGVAQACVPHQHAPAEQELLERVAEGIDRLEALAEPDRTDVRAVLDTLTSGMAFDLTRFPGEDSRDLQALETLEELDRYIFLVAGCVGDFWTRLCVRHRPTLAHWDVALQSRVGIRFGKALQMTNVLRDVPRDLREGRCYLPARELATLGLAPGDLLTDGGAARARPLLVRLLDVALDHYDAAWRYTLAIPRREVRLRLACCWPLLIGLGTLGELAAHPTPLATPVPVKLPRAAVRGLLARSTLLVWSDRALRHDAARLRARISLR